jgi:hypothetical protein
MVNVCGNCGEEHGDHFKYCKECDSFALFFFPVKTGGIVSLKVLLRRWKEKYLKKVLDKDVLKL